MLFASAEYLVFLPVVVVAYWIAPRRRASLILLLASYVFYMSFIPAYGALVFALSVANYILGLALDRTTHRKAVLVAAVTVDLTVLVFFKYSRFLVDTTGQLLDVDTSWFTLNVVLPLGISFFTFEFIHYIVDIYEGSVPIHDFTNFHVFASFFPSQIAGPIKRFQPFNLQLMARRRFDAALFEQGVWLIVRGLAKKTIFADHLSPLVASAFASGAPPDTASAWAGAYAFALQIYFDFSGYTDIGRGSALLLGFGLPENFIQPYFAVGFRDFWRRWHISLSSWLRDYLYIRLGGNRRGRRRTLVNLMITMGLGGLWHGAALHFVAWGLVHGIALAVEHVITGVSGTRAQLFASHWLARLVLWLMTLQVVVIAWVVFRAQTFDDAWAYMGSMFGFVAGRTSVPATPVIATVIVYATCVLFERLMPGAIGPTSAARGWPLRGLAYAGTVAAIILLLPQHIERFIYFQF